MERRFGYQCVVLYSEVGVEVRHRPHARVILEELAAVGLVAGVHLLQDEVAIAHDVVTAPVVVVAVHEAVAAVAVMVEALGDLAVPTLARLADGQIKVAESQDEAQVVVLVVRSLKAWLAAADHRVLALGCAEGRHQLHNGTL